VTVVIPVSVSVVAVVVAVVAVVAVVVGSRRAEANDEGEGLQHVLLCSSRTNLAAAHVRRIRPTALPAQAKNRKRL